jgi:hypothetical protein
MPPRAALALLLLNACSASPGTEATDAGEDAESRVAATPLLVGDLCGDAGVGIIVATGRPACTEAFGTVCAAPDRACLCWIKATCDGWLADPSGMMPKR